MEENVFLIHARKREQFFTPADVSNAQSVMTRWRFVLIKIMFTGSVFQMNFHSSSVIV